MTNDSLRRKMVCKTIIDLSEGLVRACNKNDFSLSKHYNTQLDAILCYMLSVDDISGSEYDCIRKLNDSVYFALSDERPNKIECFTNSLEKLGFGTLVYIN